MNARPRKIQVNELPKLARCSRCERRMRNRQSTDWNVNVRQGAIIGFLCPDCQTPEENAEAEINMSTLDYGLDGSGRLIGRLKHT